MCAAPTIDVVSAECSDRRGTRQPKYIADRGSNRLSSFAGKSHLLRDRRVREWLDGDAPRLLSCVQTTESDNFSALSALSLMISLATSSLAAIVRAEHQFIEQTSTRSVCRTSSVLHFQTKYLDMAVLVVELLQCDVT